MQSVNDLVPARFVKIGSLKLSMQAVVVAACGIVFGLVVGLTYNVVVGLIAILPFFMGAYTVNCTVVGHCTVWAWILTIVYVINVLGVVSVRFGMSSGAAMPMRKHSRK